MMHTFLKRLTLSLLLAVVVLLCFSRKGQIDPSTLLTKFNQADKFFSEAIYLSEKDPENETVQDRADLLFQRSLLQLSDLLPESANNDSLSFLILIKTGYIHFLFDSSKAALRDYTKALAIKERLPQISDSLLFVPLLYTGGIYYSRNEFDSSLHYFRQAEALNEKFGGQLKESQRLYNRLGVLYYENGNYILARNYFEKAIAHTDVDDAYLRANYELNIASLLVKLDELDEAKKSYEQILARGLYTNEANHNLGIISLRQEQYAKAVESFRKVQYDDKRNIDLYYNRSMAFAGLKRTDSAELYLHQALAENLKWNGRRENVAYGLILKYQADQMYASHQYKSSLPLYQQAIMQFAPDFKETDPAKNPGQFTGVFSYINLFHTLVNKAEALEMIYGQDKQITWLVAALETYRTAFSLAAYVETTYNSDEARLFLGKIKHTVHSHPIEIGLQLYKLTGKKSYLEDVYFFDQRNKASVLSLNINMQEMSQTGSFKDELQRREGDLRSAITRDVLKIANQQDSLELAKLRASVRDKEITLNNVREEMYADPIKRQLLATGNIPSINRLQHRLDNSTTLLSFHLSGKELLTLLISNTHFDYQLSPIPKNFQADIDQLKTALYHSNTEKRYDGKVAATSLYQYLVSPLLSSLRQTKRLIIIPDDELHYLPFEALQDEQGHYLLQKFAVQYQYSTAMLGNEEDVSLSSKVISFAPFAHQGYHDSSGSLNILPASAEETEGLNGIRLLDSAATKKNFLEQGNHYQVIHLATHAKADNQDPLRSFISFYPGSDTTRLYAGEIYQLRLDTARLIILSACETGAGQLVKGEGMMSLSRAFAYAGCPNIITSLWKAEDRTVAYITRRLHHYLQRKETIDQALRLAKLDLLKDDEIDPRLKTPDHWANLVFIGEFEPDHRKSDWIWVATGIVGVLLGYYYFKRKSQRTRKDPRL